MSMEKFNGGVEKICADTQRIFRKVAGRAESGAFEAPVGLATDPLNYLRALAVAGLFRGTTCLTQTRIGFGRFPSPTYYE